MQYCANFLYFTSVNGLVKVNPHRIVASNIPGRIVSSCRAIEAENVLANRVLPAQVRMYKRAYTRWRRRRERY
jgi:hypothetical protein